MINNETQLNIRVPLSLKNDIAKGAKKNNRSINYECIERLQKPNNLLLDKLNLIEEKLDLILSKI